MDNQRYYPLTHGIIPLPFVEDDINADHCRDAQT